MEFDRVLFHHLPPLIKITFCDIIKNPLLFQEEFSDFFIFWLGWQVPYTWTDGILIPVGARPRSCTPVTRPLRTGPFSLEGSDPCTSHYKRKDSPPRLWPVEPFSWEHKFGNTGPSPVRCPQSVAYLNVFLGCSFPLSGDARDP